MDAGIPEIPGLMLAMQRFRRGQAPVDTLGLPPLTGREYQLIDFGDDDDGDEDNNGDGSDNESVTSWYTSREEFEDGPGGD